MDVARLVEGLQEHTAGLAKAVAGADPNASVPTCPEWPLRVLVGHIGQAHRWSAGIVRSGNPGPVPNPFDADPGDPATWADWLDAGAAELVDAARASNGRVWTFFGPGPATFWLRRMAYDTVIHHADAALATGTAFEVAPDLAADAISEWLDILSDPITPSLKPSVAELRGTGQTLQLRTDAGHAWLITRAPDGVRWAPAAGTADATLAGPVRDLLLVFTRRLPADRITITGDRALVDHWLTHTAA